MNKVEISITLECMDLLDELQSNMDGAASFSDVIIGMDKTIEILTGQIAGIRTDNRPENLRWGTKSENFCDRYIHGNSDSYFKSQRHRSHCKYGHEFSVKNTAFVRQGADIRRQCIECRRTYARRYYKENRSVILASQKRLKIKKFESANG